MVRKGLTKSAVSLRTAGANGSGEECLTSEYHEATLLLNVTAKSGTNPALAVVIKTRAEGLDEWYTRAYHPTCTKDDGSSVASILDVGTYCLALPANLGAYLRVDYEIGGSNTPTITFEASLDLKD